MSERTYCTECQNTGSVQCYCGGDLCVCGEEEITCPACDGACDDLDDIFQEEEKSPAQ